MKVLDTSPIISGSMMPIKKGTLKFLQDAHKEALADFIIAMIGSSYSESYVYALWGCEITQSISGGVTLFTMAPGAVFLKGEVYHVDGNSLSIPGGTSLDMAFDISQYTVNADPVTMDVSGTIVNVHNIRKMKLSYAVSPIYGTPKRWSLQSPKQLMLYKPTTIFSDITISFTQNENYIMGCNTLFTLNFDMTNAKVGNRTNIVLVNSGTTDITGFTADVFGVGSTPFTGITATYINLEIEYLGYNTVDLRPVILVKKLNQ